jgi:cobalt/nickel transport system permease protein
VASSSEGRLGRAWLAGWAIAVFAISAVSDLRLLGAIAAAAVLLFHRRFWRTARRVLVSVVPFTAGLSLVSWAWLQFVARSAPDPTPFLALGARTIVIAFVTFSVLARVDLFRALAPWPSLTRLFCVILAQIHALRLLATESLQGLRSRMPKKPGALDLIRGAGGITGALFGLATRNARDVSDAMRSRGF